MSMYDVSLFLFKRCSNRICDQRTDKVVPAPHGARFLAEKLKRFEQRNFPNLAFLTRGYLTGEVRLNFAHALPWADYHLGVPILHLALTRNRIYNISYMNYINVSFLISE